MIFLKTYKVFINFFRIPVNVTDHTYDITTQPNGFLGTIEAESEEEVRKILSKEIESIGNLRLLGFGPSIEIKEVT